MRRSTFVEFDLAGGAVVEAWRPQDSSHRRRGRLHASLGKPSGKKEACGFGSLENALTPYGAPSISVEGEARSAPAAGGCSKVLLMAGLSQAPGRQTARRPHHRFGGGRWCRNRYSRRCFVVSRAKQGLRTRRGP